MEFKDWSSWAVWAPAGTTVKSNIGITDFFNDADLLSLLNSEYMFVGLNASRQVTGPWSNFHSDHKNQNDFKLRFAFQETRFWGSYLTDIFKGDGTIETNSSKFLDSITDEMIIKAIGDLRKEIAILENPKVIAFGNDAFKILSKNIDGIEIIKIRHYSDYISKENYRREILEILKNV